VEARNLQQKVADKSECRFLAEAVRFELTDESPRR
jgi:hypothetical protein